MPISERARWTAAIVFCTALLLAPAIWNGFPLIFPDTGGYLARPFEGTLSIGRSALYGAFLAAGIPLDFWPNVLAQAALCIWLIAITLRALAIASTPLRLAIIVVSLCALTSLPFYAAQLMPDILVPCAVLALFLLAFASDTLRRGEMWLLVAVVAFGAACHMSMLALAIGFVLVLAIARLATLRGMERPALSWPALALTLGVALAPLSNLALTGQFAFTPGGANFLFARVFEDSIIKRYLADICPRADIRLCAIRAELPTTADEWLWDEGTISKMGGAEDFAPEAAKILRETLVRYPFAHLRAAIRAAARQFVAVETGDGLTDYNPHAEWTFERFAPRAAAAYKTSRQDRAPLDFTIINAFEVPVALGAIVLLAAALLLHRRLRLTPRATALAAFVLVALLGNAAICGIFSNPHARYQSRLVWLAPFALAVAALSRPRRKQDV